ncbi:MAG: cyclic pyranopterin monophosphate synthase MoaC [Rhodospirillaceae bacterium]|nr:cyclic pyranopterin monophosphate synthase MoaC [Rhodospirillaceae bacterium]
MPKLTHINDDGKASMVDVTEKKTTQRTAIARGFINMTSNTIELVESGGAKKGDVLSTARLAGIMAAKKTHDLIPLCHPLALTSISVDFNLHKESNSIEVIAKCGLRAQTGVEMEALTAVSVATLTIYDMCKAVDRDMQISNIRLISKTGGQSGDFEF